MTKIAGNVCHQLKMLKHFFGFSNRLGRQVHYHNEFLFPTFFFKDIEISFVTCIVDLVGQVRLTTILTISISVIRSARKMIIFCFIRFSGRQIQRIQNWLFCLHR